DISTGVEIRDWPEARTFSNPMVLRYPLFARCVREMRKTVMAERAKRAVKKAPPSTTGLAAAITTAPKLSAPKAARARVEDWLAEIARSEAGKAIKQIIAPAKPREGKISEVIAAIAEASPYLWDLIRGHPERFLALLQA